MHASLSAFRSAHFAGSTALGLADSWPTKPIKAVVPFGAGSATDIIPRIVFEQLQGQLGQSIVVENRGGAGGTIGAAQVVKSDPDGYTWLVHSSAHTVAPALYPSLPFKPESRSGADVDDRQRAQCADHLAVQGHQDGPGLRRLRQGQSGQAEFCIASVSVRRCI